MAAEAPVSYGKNPERAAEKLGSVHLMAVPKEGHLMIEASVKFGVPRFEAGDYIVFVGLREASLCISPPEFDLSEPYEAKIKREHYHETFHKDVSTEVSGKAEGEGGFRIFRFFSVKASGMAQAQRKNETTAESESEFLIIAAEPQNTWHIGSRLGDPRRPAGATHDGVKHCLHGEYFHASAGEEGRGPEGRPGKKALCRLDPKSTPGANDKRIIASLYGAPGALQVALERKPGSPMKVDPKFVEREKELREKIIQICVERGTRDDRAAGDARLSGEFFLHSHEILAPTVSKATRRSGGQS